jgi:protein SCO1/2
MQSIGSRLRIIVCGLLIGISSLALAQGNYGGGGMTGGPQLVAPPPSILKNIEIEQKLGSQLPLDAVFKDENGREVKLGDYFGKRPVVLNLVYYQCPMLCGEILNGMTSAFRILNFDIGKDFDVVTVSFDPREGADLAAAKKKRFIERYGRAGADAGWHFLTGSPASINALTSAVGFKYQWDERSQQFAHAAAIMVATPKGELAQYLYGVEFAPKDLRLALVEASHEKLGTLVDKVLLYCYHYDPRTGKYGALVSRIMQIAGAITIVILGGGLLLLFKLEPKQRVSGKKDGRGTSGGNA